MTDPTPTGRLIAAVRAGCDAFNPGPPCKWPACGCTVGAPVYIQPAVAALDAYDRAAQTVTPELRERAISEAKHSIAANGWPDLPRWAVQNALAAAVAILPPLPLPAEVTAEMVEAAAKARQDAEAARLAADRYGQGRDRMMRWDEIPECDYKEHSRANARAALTAALAAASCQPGPKVEALVLAAHAVCDGRRALEDWRDLHAALRPFSAIIWQDSGPPPAANTPQPGEAPAAGAPAPGWLAEDLAIAREQIAADPYTPGAPGHTAAVARASAAPAAMTPDLPLPVLGLVLSCPQCGANTQAKVDACQHRNCDAPTRADRRSAQASHTVTDPRPALIAAWRDQWTETARLERDARVQEAALATEKTAKERYAYCKAAALPFEADAWSSIASLAAVLGSNPP